MKSIKLFGRVASFAKAIQENLFGFKPIETPKTPQMPKMPKIDHPSLFDEPQEGTVKQFGQNDIRRLETTKSGVKRYVNADQTDMFSQPAEEKQPEPEVTTPEPEPEAEPAKEETLDEMVKRILDEKQKGRKFLDVNDRVSGSKKEMATIRKLSAADLLKQDSVTQFHTITKEKVLNPFDPIAHKEAGESPGLVFLKLKLRQALGSKPENNDLARKLYVEEMPTTLQAIEDAKSYDEIIKIAQSKFKIQASFRGRGTKMLKVANYKESPIDTEGFNAYEKAQTPAADTVYGTRFFNVLLQLSDSGVAAWEEARKKDAVTEELVESKYNEYVVKTASKLIKEVQQTNSASDNEILNHLRGYGGRYGIALGILDEHGEVKPEYRKEYEYRLGKTKPNKSLPASLRDFSRQTEAIKRIADNVRAAMSADELSQAADRGRKDIISGLEQYNKPISIDDFKKKHPLKEADWSFIKTDTEGTETNTDTEGKEKQPKIKTDLRIHSNPTLKNIVRRGGEPITDEEIKTESIINDLGFKSVQYGNYVKDAEAKEHVKNFIGAVKDLGVALNLDIKALNEIGGISLAFGARGSGSASAHYEPMRKIINLTKTRGDGSVSHEWGHYIDHIIGGAIAGLEKEKGYLTVNLSKTLNAKNSYSAQIEARKRIASLNPVEKAALSVVSIIQSQGERVVSKKVEPSKDELGYYIPQIKAAYNGDRVHDEYYNPVTLRTPEERFAFCKEYIEKRIGEGEKEKAYTYLAKLEGKPISFDIKVKQTKFYESAGEMGGYWVRPQELFARAFESYVQDKLEEKGMFNNYLVAGNKVNGEAPKYPNFYLETIHPQGSERANINLAFDKLIDAIRDQYQQKEPAMKSRIIFPFRNTMNKAIRPPKLPQDNFFGLQPIKKQKQPGTKYDPEFKAETPSTGTVKVFKNGDKRILMPVGNGEVRRWMDYEEAPLHQYDMFNKNPYRDEVPKQDATPEAPEPAQEVLFGSESRNKPIQNTEQLTQGSFFSSDMLEQQAEKTQPEINIEDVLKLEPSDNEDRFFGTKVLVKDKYSKEPFEAYLSRILSVTGGGFTYEISRENPMNGGDPSRFRYDADQIKEILELKDWKKEKSAKENRGAKPETGLSDLEKQKLTDLYLERENVRTTLLLYSTQMSHGGGKQSELTKLRNELYDVEKEIKQIEDRMPKQDNPVDKSQQLIQDYAVKVAKESQDKALETLRKTNPGYVVAPQRIQEALAESTKQQVNYYTDLYNDIQNKDYGNLTDKLHRGNKNSRKFFEQVTGTKLGKTNREDEAILSEFTGKEKEPLTPVMSRGHAINKIYQDMKKEKYREGRQRLNEIKQKEEGRDATDEEFHAALNTRGNEEYFAQMKERVTSKVAEIMDAIENKDFEALEKNDNPGLVIMTFDYYLGEDITKYIPDFDKKIPSNDIPDADDKPQNPFDEVEAEDMKPYIHPVKRRTTPLVDDIITFKYNGRERTGSFRGKSGGGWVVYDKTTGGQDIVDPEKVENLTIKNNPHDKNFGDPEYIKYAHESGNYDEWIRDGRMTRKQVNEILQSAGIEPVQKSVNTNPSQAQIEAGNYKKEHIRLYGMEISIENPKGSVRSGVDNNGERWSVKMKNDYGYIRGTVGKDKDHVDVFIGDDKGSEKVFIINQIDPKTEEFDEHKCMLGFPDRETAIAAYKSNYNDSDRVNRIGSIKEMDIDEFKGWVYKPKKTKEIAKSVQIQAAQRTKLVFGRRMNRA